MMPVSLPRSNPNYRKIYYQHNKEREVIRQKAYRAENLTWIKPMNKQWSCIQNRFLRAKIMIALGGRCVCCSESNYNFLAIDHINGGGNEEKKLVGSGTRLLQHIIDQGIPTDKYQLLCHSCNQAKHNHRECPHQRFNIFDKTTW